MLRRKTLSPRGSPRPLLGLLPAQLGQTPDSAEFAERSLRRRALAASNAPKASSQLLPAAPLPLQLQDWLVLGGPSNSGVSNLLLGRSGVHRPPQTPPPVGLSIRSPSSPELWANSQFAPPPRNFRSGRFRWFHAPHQLECVHTPSQSRSSHARLSFHPWRLPTDGLLPRLSAPEKPCSKPSGHPARPELIVLTSGPRKNRAGIKAQVPVQTPGIPLL